MKIGKFLIVVLFVVAAGPLTAQERPYSPHGPWNLKIGPDPVYDSSSDVYIAALSGVFGSDPTRYTMPVYTVAESTPLVQVHVKGVFSKVADEDRLEILKDVWIEAPVPGRAEPADGTDAQLIVWNTVTGDEWGFWRMYRDGDGWVAQNGYFYNTLWSGVPPSGFVSRGAGVPYLTGLIRPWEIETGAIDHAIAFGVDYPSPLHVYPATKSDGRESGSLPMGARLQLDPGLTDADFDYWGLDRAGKIIARALQEYGMILIDGSGHPKIYAEYEGTARWNGVVAAKTVESIPYSAFRVLDTVAPVSPAPPARVQAKVRKNDVSIYWRPSAEATRYQVFRRGWAEANWSLVDDWVEGTEYVDRSAASGGWLYGVASVNHNGVGRIVEAQYVGKGAVR